MCPVSEVAQLPSIEAAQFKETMRRIASTVTVVTSRSGAVMGGMTATAVCSVSAAPPSILVVVNQSNKSHALIEKVGAFAVNILSEKQSALAEHFALKSDDPFAGVKHCFGVTGSPILSQCVASFECALESQIKSGTHSIFVGRVVNVDAHNERPLLHSNGNFVKLEQSRSM